MLRKADMQKAQAYPLRYGEYFCSGKAVKYKQCQALNTTRLLNGSDTFSNSLHLSANENRLI